jgi:hypothetical protein
VRWKRHTEKASTARSVDWLCLENRQTAKGGSLCFGRESGMRQLLKGWVLAAAVVLLGAAVPAFPAGERQEKEAELESLKQELKPLRAKAEKDPDVLAARAKVDAAFRAYYEVLRKKMAELEPAQKKKIQREMQLREELYGKNGGSRVENNSKPKAAKSNFQTTKQGSK